jgi:hypothetical protein
MAMLIRTFGLSFEEYADKEMIRISDFDNHLLDIKWGVIKANTKRQKPSFFPSRFFLFQSPVA